MASADVPFFWTMLSACSRWNDRPGFAIRAANAALAACASSAFGSIVGVGVGGGEGVTTGVMKTFAGAQPATDSPSAITRARVARAALTFRIVVGTGAG